MTLDAIDDDQDRPRAHRRDGAATREAILRSAVSAFTRSGYDGAGLREIAGSAGVTAMMVNRYFGTKEQLFAEAVDIAFAPRTILVEDGPGLAHGAATELVARTAPEAEHLDPFLLMLRSAPNPRAAEIIRAGIERHVGSRVEAQLTGAAAGERSELLLSLIAGIWLMRKVIGTPALAAAEPGALTAEIKELFRLLTGEIRPNR
ncbi:TetR/AcrR family transcriptional regulator [Pseudonocardia alaniniphila]|uniref:TetR family transcriptional regulator n=1 Tax=Pseudonocardia alaniniphila TaxID=75291 RepID=A0ABS9T764_9PSEU|nr:TetR/AcrR family transcriptional regulator [Pseudonocardia alaniniphila]MCH6164372.1 TetR family transcriptional regulator [Pseudonocardia alaniniphila]